MPFTTAGANRMLDAFVGIPTGNPVAAASLHNGVPGDPGANELSGGAPAYARKAVGFLAAASRQLVKNATDPIFDIPAGTSVMFVGYWTSLAGGTCLGWSPVAGGASHYATATANVITSYGHGLSGAHSVLVDSVPGTALPGGLVPGTLYQVALIDSDSFTLTLAGAPVAFASGEFRVTPVFPEVYANQGTMLFDSAILTFD